MNCNNKVLEDIRQGFEKYDGLNNLTVDIEKVTKENLIRIHGLGVIFLGVDTFLQNEVNSIIKFFMGKGFNILKICLRKRLTRSEVENLFLPNNSCLNCGDFRWWMIQDSMSLGPLMAVIVHLSDSTSDNNCLKRLNFYKGKGDPFEGKPGTIRNDFSAINISMNLIHIPDNYSDFVKDIAPFFSVSEIESILNDTKLIESRGMKGKNYLSKIELFDIYINSRVNNYKHSFFRSLYITKFELLKAIKGIYEEITQLLDICIDYIITIEKELNRFENLKLMRERNVKEIVLVNEISRKIRSEIGNPELSNELLLIEMSDFKKISSYLAFCNEDNYNFVSERFISDIEAEGIVLSAIDRHIILTTCAQWKRYTVE